RTVRRWAASVDAAAAEAEHEAASAREHLTVSRRSDGVVLQGFLTHEHGEALVLALRAVAGVPAADDSRSREQRQAAALVDASRLVLDRGLAGGGQSVRPHLSVLVPWETLRSEALRAAAQDESREADPTWLPAGWCPDESASGSSAPAQTTGGTIVPRSVLDRLACDSEISRIVFGPDGEVLDVGRARRTYTGQQRRAVIARDQSCRYPGCGAPVALGEVHHVVSWAHGGRTSVANGVLLCWFHHELVHRRGIAISRRGGEGVACRWAFVGSDGRVIGDEGEVSRSSDRDGVDAQGRGPSGAVDPPPGGPLPGAVDPPPGGPPARGSTHRRAAPACAQDPLPIPA
ncbi:DUF222 domain-containing protein, partial [Actinotalea sp.]|uniref:HNH endonuclease signature motif containing protein n=1 Tax=Actinotalea sp. TaxID=1872145 RepID=UPI003569EA15